MRAHTVRSNGLSLNVLETGKEDAHAILFIHGFSQSWLAWRKQLESDLAGDFQLIAMDLRGHGASDKPRGAYADSKVWADDIHTVIDSLKLDRPVLCGWSYAGFVICDYLRHYGESEISGINLVGAATDINAEIAPQILGAGFLGLLPGFFSTDVEESVSSLLTFIRMCSETEMPWNEFCMTLGYNALVPPHVRQGLLSRTIDNDDVLKGVTVPVMITQGERDRIVNPAVAQEIAASIKSSRISTYRNAGHAVFLDDVRRFNDELRRFAASTRVVQEARAS